MSFILQDEIPHFTYPFIDDLLVKSIIPINDPLVKSITTCYQYPDSSYETILDNQGIWHFIWEHLQVVHHILQQLQNARATVPTKKFILATPDATIVGHKCTFDGHIPQKNKVQKIHDWPKCQNLAQVCGFLGVCGVL